MRNHFIIAYELISFGRYKRKTTTTTTTETTCRHLQQTRKLLCSIFTSNISKTSLYSFKLTTLILLKVKSKTTRTTAPTNCNHNINIINNSNTKCKKENYHLNKVQIKPSKRGNFKNELENELDKKYYKFNYKTKKH